MDLEHADPGADAAADQRRPSRRSLIAMAGAAGLAGAAASLLAERAVGATPAGERPNVPTDADVELLRAALALELAARDLYLAQLAADPDGELAGAVAAMAENHEAYAQAIAGFTGTSAKPDARNDEVFDANVDAFESRDFAAAAHELEQVAVATHTALLGQYESSDAIYLTASVLVVEARHATVLASVLGVDDLDTLFGNEQSALTVGGA